MYSIILISNLITFLNIKTYKQEKSMTKNIYCNYRPEIKLYRDKNVWINFKFPISQQECLCSLGFISSAHVSITTHPSFDVLFATRNSCR